MELAGYGSVPDPSHRVVNGVKRHREPFSRARAILDLDFQAGRGKDPVDHLLQPALVDVVELVGSNNIDI